jgi:hypothetical protein
MMPMHLRVWRQVIARETLMPVSRAELLKAVGVAVLIDIVQMWLAFCVINAIFWSVRSPQMLWDARTWAATIVFSSAAVGFFGAACWLIRIERDSAWIGGVVVLVMSIMVFGDAMIGLRLQDWVLVAALLPALGVFLAWRAYRYWLNVDLA